MTGKTRFTGVRDSVPESHPYDLIIKLGWNMRPYVTVEDSEGRHAINILRVREICGLVLDSDHPWPSWCAPISSEHTSYGTASIYDEEKKVAIFHAEKIVFYRYRDGLVIELVNPKEKQKNELENCIFTERRPEKRKGKRDKDGREIAFNDSACKGRI